MGELLKSSQSGDGGRKSFDFIAVQHQGLYTLQSFEVVLGDFFDLVLADAEREEAG